MHKQCIYIYINKLSFRESFIFLQIVLAVEFLHALGLVYRNFKPENVLITINGYLQLSDFSLSKRIGRGRTYTLCGTPDYMAPELIAFTGYSRAVDFWSSGVMLYEMVAGHLPFAGRNLNDLFENIAYSKYIICESFSPPLQDLITKIVQVNLNRYDILPQLSIKSTLFNYFHKNSIPI